MKSRRKTDGRTGKPISWSMVSNTSRNPPARMPSCNCSRESSDVQCAFIIFDVRGVTAALKP